MPQPLANLNVRQRLTQILVLTVLILAAWLFFQPAEAGLSRHNKASEQSH